MIGPYLDKLVDSAGFRGGRRDKLTQMPLENPQPRFLEQTGVGGFLGWQVSEVLILSMSAPVRMWP